MPYQVSNDVDGRPRITLTGEPSYCHALDSATPTDGRQGTWLVMDFAAWSVSDVVAVQTALDAARHFGGALKLGLLPYTDPEDLEGWPWHEDADGPSPHWVLTRDGAVRWRHSGALALDELIKAISDQATVT
ncbi:hypothetical protein Rhe02_03120 [Rhizocola hellebori]|uniref:Uncharacterized protein n=1 Tax=Rhizocola hellebori TaxID=1392758 RepID=A0A8J3VD02_9ACTN|nr:hypothetical protein [Rhizocola hellebori]GIH02245.1 hypothetical protein Rhe02_03120 [Rhizocola hellebori]